MAGLWLSDVNFKSGPIYGPKSGYRQRDKCSYSIILRSLTTSRFFSHRITSDPASSSITPQASLLINWVFIRLGIIWHDRCQHLNVRHKKRCQPWASSTGLHVAPGCVRTTVTSIVRASTDHVSCVLSNAE